MQEETFSAFDDDARDLGGKKKGGGGGTKRITEERGKESECIFLLFRTRPPSSPLHIIKEYYYKEGGRRPEFSRKKSAPRNGFRIFFLKEKIRDRHVRTGMSLSNTSHARIPLSFFSFPFSIGKGDGWAGYQFLLLGKSAHAAGPQKKEKRRRGKQCQTRSQPPFHFPPSLYPCHSFPSHFLQSIFSLPPSFGPVSSSPLPPLLFPYRGVNRMRYSRLGEGRDRRGGREMDGRTGDGRKWNNHHLYWTIYSFSCVKMNVRKWYTSRFT